MIEALRRIKTKFKTGCITNNVPSMRRRSAHGRTFYAREIMELFDHVIESSKAGIRKPNPRIYQMMCETLDVKPEACVYLDDLGRQSETGPRHGHDDDQGRNPGRRPLPNWKPRRA